MATTNNRMQRHWPKVQIFIQKHWPKFTNVEFKRINGDFDLFAQYLNEFYNDFPRTEALARTRLQDFLNQCDLEDAEE